MRIDWTAQVDIVNYAITPFWTFAQDVDPSVPSTTVEISLFDHDSFFNDEPIDISPTSGTTLILNLDMTSGSWTSAFMSANQGYATGDGAFADGWAKIFFDVSVLSDADGSASENDADGDGLLDGWETFGVDTDGDFGETTSGSFVNLPAFGANPRHKDLFLELDWIAGAEPQREVIQTLKAVFDVAPMTAGTQAAALIKGVNAKVNPDGQAGIHLWVDTGAIADPASGLPVGDNLGGGNQVFPVNPNISNLNSRFDAAKMLDSGRDLIFRHGLSANFPGDLSGTSGPGNTAFTLNAPNQSWLPNEWVGKTVTVTDATGMVQTQPIVSNTANQLTVGLTPAQIMSGVTTPFMTIPAPISTFTINYSNGGWGEVGGNDFIEYNHDAGSILHELGHTLNLGHGGSDGINRKPNYLSVMNYDHQFGVLRGDGGSSVDFSGVRLSVGGTPSVSLDSNLFDVSQNWVVNQWAMASWYVEIVIPGSPGSRQTRRILSNTTNTLIVADVDSMGAPRGERWTSAPDTSWRYTIFSAATPRGEEMVGRFGEAQVLIKIGAAQTSAVLYPALAAGLFYENPPHRFSRCGEEMAPAVPALGLVHINQPNVGFVNQGGSLQRLSRLLLRHPLRRQLAQLIIDQRQQLLGGTRVALFDGREDAGDVGHEHDYTGTVERLLVLELHKTNSRPCRPTGRLTKLSGVAMALPGSLRRAGWRSPVPSPDSR